MIHRPECRRYKQWKIERAKKLKQNDKKEKKKKPKRKKVVDCIDIDSEPQPAKVSHRKCKKARVRRKRPKKMALYVVKHVPLSELALKKIKPSMEVRELLLNPRHTACLKPSMAELDVAMMESAKCLMMQQQRKKCPRRRKRRKKRTKKTAQDGESREVGGEEDADAKSKDTIANESKKSASSRSKAMTKKRETSGKKAEADEDSEEDECITVCSFDSQICLAGVKLTADDKKKIQQHQREVQDANTEEKTDAPD